MIELRAVPSVPEVAATCARLRRTIVDTAVGAGAGHIAPAYSVLEVVTALYVWVLDTKANEPRWAERDRFILSKGHGCLALYAVLAEHGFFPKATLATFTKPGSFLGGHPDLKVPGVDATTGSLGHGLPMGVGMALAAKLDHRPRRTFVVLSDGECQEGSVWEAALLGAHLGLERLTVVIDHNKLQSLGPVDEVMSSAAPVADKWRAFGWAVTEVDGHDLAALREAFARLPLVSGRPTAIVAHTVKGKGVSYMEQNPIWHYRIPNADELARAHRELERE
jgi:transketolase